MPALAFLLNLLWIVFGGLWMAVAWVIAAVIMAITIVGLPWAWAAFNIASYTLLPFGRKAVSRAEHLGRHDIGTVEGYCTTFLRYALHHPVLGERLRSAAAALLDDRA